MATRTSSPGDTSAGTSSLRAQYTAVFAFALGVALLSGAAALYELGVTRSESRDFIHEGVERLRLAERLHAGLYRAQVAEDHFLTRNEADDLAQFHVIIAEMQADGARLEVLGGDASASINLAQQMRLVTQYAALVDATAELTQGKRELTDPAEFRALLKKRDRVLVECERLSQETLSWTLARSAAYAERVETSFERLWLSTIVTTLVVLIGGGLLFRVGGRVVGRVVRMATSIRTITASNDLKQRLAVESRDEVGTLAGAFNTLLVQQEEFVRELDDAGRRDKERADALEVAYAELRAATAELTRSQQKLMETDKLSAIGQLAAGVAHEINNPSAAVRTNLEWLRTALVPLLDMLVAAHPVALAHADVGTRQRLLAPPESGDLPGAAREIDDVIGESIEVMGRIATIVRDLGTFSRKSEEIERFDPTEALEVALKMANHVIKNRATVVRDYQPLPRLSASRGRLQQVFLNLLVNAAQAIPKGAASRHEIRVSTRVEGSQVKIIVQDTGSGIALENRARVFDPFFTTKPAGQGTGLGLAISNDIVRRHGGEMTLESELGVGTTITIALPIDDAKAAAALKSAPGAVAVS